MDKDESGTITFDEFRTYMIAKKRQRSRSMKSTKAHSSKKMIQM